MALRVLLPTALRHLVGNQEEVQLTGGTVAEVMSDLVTKFPELKKHLFNAEGKLRNFVNVYVNDEDVRYLQDDKTSVKESDVVSIVPSIAGGNIAAIEETFAGVELSNDEIARYSRHLIMPEVGMEGQKKLKAAKVLLIGTGGLGAPLGLYLAAAGIGRIGLGRFRCGGLQQLAAAGDSQHQGRRTAQAVFREGENSRYQSAHSSGYLRDDAPLRQCDGNHQGL